MLVSNMGDLGDRFIVDPSGKLIAHLHGRKIVKLASGYTMKKVSRHEITKAQRAAQTAYSISGDDVFGVGDGLFDTDAAVNPLSQVFMPGIKRSDYAVNPLSGDGDVFMPGIKRSDYAVNPLSGDGDVFMPGIKRSDYAVNPLSDYDAAVNPLSGAGQWKLKGVFKGRKLGQRRHDMDYSQMRTDARLHRGENALMGDSASMF